MYPLQELLPGAIRYVQGAGELYIFGRRCWVVGANDERAEEKVRGMTLASAYMNEVTLYPQGVFDQTIARLLSIEGSKIFADCNPDSPYHWLNTEFLLKDHDKGYLKRWRFRLPDNPILPPANVEMIKALYAPGTLFYRRMIEGEWVAAEGNIYEQWDESVHVVDQMPGTPERVIIGIDYGIQNATVFLALGKIGQTWYVFDEYYHSGRDTHRQKTDAEYSSDLIDFISRIGYIPQSIEIDPSAASFKVQLRRDGVRKIRDADHAVVPGIAVVSSGLTAGKLKILRRCESLRSEVPGYVWNEKKAKEAGKEEPMKGEGIRDHALDALRYACMRALGRPTLRVLSKPAGA